MKLLPVSLAVAALLSSPLAMAKTVNAVASFSILGDIVQEVGGACESHDVSRTGR